MRRFLPIVSVLILCGAMTVPALAYDTPEEVTNAFFEGWTSRNQGDMRECFPEDADQAQQDQLFLIVDAIRLSNHEVLDSTTSGNNATVVTRLTGTIDDNRLLSALVEITRPAWDDPRADPDERAFRRAFFEAVLRSELPSFIQRLQQTLLSPSGMEVPCVRQDDAWFISPEFDPGILNDGAGIGPGPGPGPEMQPTSAGLTDAERERAERVSMRIRSGQTATHTFTVEEAGEWCFTTECDFDVMMALFTEDGQFLTENDDGGEGFNPLIRRRLQPGNYEIAVRPFDDYDSGNVTLLLVAPVIVPREWRESRHTLDEGEEIEVPFEAEIAGDYIFTTEGDLDLHMGVRNDTGRTIVEDEDSGTGRNPLITVRLQPGDYTLVIRGFNRFTRGDFTLRMGVPLEEAPRAERPSNNGGDETPDGIVLQLESRRNTLYEFDVEETTTITITTDAEWAIRLILKDPDGDTIAREQGTDDDPNPVIEMELRPGHYRLYIRGVRSEAEGEFGLIIEGLE